MKKTIAIILSLVMLFGLFAINTFAAGTPTVKVVTNEGSPVASGTATYFTVKFSNFESIQGMDITIKTDSNATLSDYLEVTGFGITPKKDENYTFSASQIHIVDLTGGKSGNIIFKATTNKNAKITVEGKYAENGQKLFNIAAVNGNIEVVDPTPIQPTPATGNTLSQPATGKFIPYGSVYKTVGSEIVFAKKDANGSFDISAGDYEYDEFTIPANGIVTFGVTDPIDGKTQNALRFGNYFNKSLTGNTTYGTMIFEGDWLAIKELYIRNGYTVQETLKLFSDDYDAKKKNHSNINYVSYKIGSKTFRVYKFAQTKYLWKNGNVLEYAINITGVTPGETYTSIAYFVNNGTTTIAETVKSEIAK